MTESSANDGKRRKSSPCQWRNEPKKRKQLTLDVGMTGFLCTCNFRERNCVRDAYALLSEFADGLFDGIQATKVEAENKDEDDKDISETLQDEIDDLKAELEKPSYKAFQAVDTGVKNVLFIRSTVPDPVLLATKILDTLNETKKLKSRFLLRLLPVEVVCKAYINDIQAKAEVLFDKYFVSAPKTFSIVFNRRSNNNIQRDEVIHSLAAIISKKNPANKASLKDPEIAVVVEIIRSRCLIAIAPNYFKLKKYNLMEICNAKEKVNDKETVKIKAADIESGEKEKVEDTAKAVDEEVTSVQETEDTEKEEKELTNVTEDREDMKD